MINGMTGFGHAQFSIGTSKSIVEVKTVNHRYLDITYYLPTGLGSLESKIRQLIEQNLNRGKVNIALKLTHKPSAQVIFNKDVVRQYLHNINQIKKEFNLKNDVTIANLICLPGVFETKESILTAENVWDELEGALKKALRDLTLMRKSEGRSLHKDISDNLLKMNQQIKVIQDFTKKHLKEHKSKLTNDEFSSFQKSNDINEELARLKHYIDELKDCLKSNVSVGKKIDFIAQEMQRETNTIGSKVQENVVSQAVIALKSKIEKIREQANNIE